MYIYISGFECVRCAAVGIRNPRCRCERLPRGNGLRITVPSNPQQSKGHKEIFPQETQVCWEQRNDRRRPRRSLPEQRQGGQLYVEDSESLRSVETAAEKRIEPQRRHVVVGPEERMSRRGDVCCGGRGPELQGRRLRFRAEVAVVPAQRLQDPGAPCAGATQRQRPRLPNRARRIPRDVS